MSESDGSIHLEPIGVVHSPFMRREGTPIQGAFAPDARGKVEIFEQYAEGLADLDGFSHIWLLYHFHQSTEYKMRVVPFMDVRERGLFSTRAPRRPNPIGLSLVRLLSVEGNVLHIAEIDIVHGTPVLDIKPYSPQMDGRPDARCGWMDEVDPETRKSRSRADKRFIE